MAQMQWDSLRMLMLVCWQVWAERAGRHLEIGSGSVFDFAKKVAIMGDTSAFARTGEFFTGIGFRYLCCLTKESVSLILAIALDLIGTLESLPDSVCALSCPSAQIQFWTRETISPRLSSLHWVMAKPD